jgi:hypothetical protein
MAQVPAGDGTLCPMQMTPTEVTFAAEAFGAVCSSLLPGLIGLFKKI